jgi:serine/threonine protein kinase
MRYVSPETALDEVTSFKSDIWSLGLVIYEVLTARRGWESIVQQSKIIVALS